MITATLARIENYPGFLGSFDNEDTWWKSEPIPGIQTILSVAWIYGEYHVCSAKMIDGTYSIWQSYNHGYSWREQLNTSEKIYEVIQPDYGIALASTSGGWWRSTNAGTDWTKISTQAPGCHTVKEITKNILVALDGTYIWRSADGGFTWTKAVKYGTSTPVTAITLYPTVDGTYNDIFVGCTESNTGKSGNNRLLYSDDGGVSFLSWLDVPTSTGLNGWTNRSDYRPADVFTDIELARISEVSAEPGTQPIWFIFQVLMPAGYFRHYRVRRAEWWWPLEPVAVFDGYATPGKSLFSIEDNVSGTDEVRRRVIFSGMDSNQFPLMKISDDGGFNWIDVSPADATVYIAPDSSDTTSNPFVDDSYITYAWTHGTCHNGWKYVSSYFEKYQSYDMDFRIQQFEYHDAEYDASAYVEGSDGSTYKGSTRLEADGDETYDAAAILAIDHDSSYDAYAVLEKVCSKTYRAHRYLEGDTTASYQMGSLILSTTFPTIILPQSLNVRFPWVAESSYPYDSREG